MPDFLGRFRRQDEIPQDLRDLAVGINIKSDTQMRTNDNGVGIDLPDSNNKAHATVFEIDHAALKKTLAAHKHNLLALGKALCEIPASESTQNSETTQLTQSIESYRFNPMIVNIFRAMWNDDSEERIYKGEEAAFLKSIGTNNDNLRFDYTKNLCDIPESELAIIGLTQEEFRQYVKSYLNTSTRIRQAELLSEETEQARAINRRTRHLAMYVAPFRGSKFNKGYNFEDFHKIQSALEYLETKDQKKSKANNHENKANVEEKLADAIRNQDDINIVTLQSQLNALSSKTVSRDLIQQFLTPEELETWDGCQTLANGRLGYFARLKNNKDIKNLVTAAQANCLGQLKEARHAHDVCESLKHATIETITNHRPNRFSKWFYGVPFAIGCGFMIFSSVLIAAAFALLAYPLAILMGNATTYVNSAITRIVPESTMNLGKKRFFGKLAGGLRWYHDAVTGQLRTRTGTRKWIFIATFIPVTATSICVGALTFYLMGWEQLKLSVLLKPLVFAMTKGSFAATATTLSVMSYVWLILVVTVVTIGSVAAFTALLIDAWNALLQKHTSSLELEINRQEIRSYSLTRDIAGLSSEDDERREAYQIQLYALQTSIKENNQRLNTRNPFKLFYYALNDLIKAKYQGQIQQNARRIKNETTAAIWLMPVGIAVCLLGVGGTVYTGYVALKFLAPALFAWMGPVLPITLVAIGILSFIGQGPSFYMRNCMKFYVKVIGAISDLIAGSSNHEDARSATIHELQQDGADMGNARETSPEDNSLIGVDEFGCPVLDPNYALTASQRFWNWVKAKFGIGVAIVNAAGNGALTIPSVRNNIRLTNHPVATSVIDNTIIGSATLNSLQAYMGSLMTDAEYKTASRRAGAQTNAVAAAICGGGDDDADSNGPGNKPRNKPGMDGQYSGPAAIMAIAGFKNLCRNNAHQGTPGDGRTSINETGAGTGATYPSDSPTDTMAPNQEGHHAADPAAALSTGAPAAHSTCAPAALSIGAPAAHSTRAPAANRTDRSAAVAAVAAVAAAVSPHAASSTAARSTATQTTPPSGAGGSPAGLGYAGISKSLSPHDQASPGDTNPSFGLTEADNPNPASTAGCSSNPTTAGPDTSLASQRLLFARQTQGAFSLHGTPGTAFAARGETPDTGSTARGTPGQGTDTGTGRDTTLAAQRIASLAFANMLPPSARKPGVLFAVEGDTPDTSATGTPAQGSGVTGGDTDQKVDEQDAEVRKVLEFK